MQNLTSTETASNDDKPDCQYLRCQKLKARVISRISCLVLVEKIWEVFHGCSPHAQLCCSTHDSIFLTNVAHLWGNKQAFQLYKLYCQEALLLHRKEVIDQRNFLTCCGKNRFMWKVTIYVVLQIEFSTKPLNIQASSNCQHHFVSVFIPCCAKVVIQIRVMLLTEQNRTDVPLTYPRFSRAIPSSMSHLYLKVS